MSRHKIFKYSLGVIIVIFAFFIAIRMATFDTNLNPEITYKLLHKTAKGYSLLRSVCFYFSREAM